MNWVQSVILGLVKSLCEIIAKDAPADVEALKACTYPGSTLTVTDLSSIDVALNL